MYGGREHDLKHLKSVFENKRKPKATRRLAYRAFQNILKQLEDTELQEMRLRLIRASQAGDTEFVENMSERIRDYARRKGYKSSQR